MAVISDNLRVPTSVDPLTPTLAAILCITVAAAVAAFLATRPRAAFAVWMLTLACVPFWFQLPSLPIPPATIAFAIVAPAIWVNRPIQKKWLLADSLLSGVILLGMIAHIIIDSPRYAITAVILQWMTAYLVGRRLALVCGWRYTNDLLAIVGVAAGMWSLIEYFAHWHAFEGTGNVNASLGFWAEIQLRGGVARSEGAFGHAIALGGFLAMTIPFAFTYSRRSLRLPFVAIVFAGILFTLSRGPILSAVLVVIMSLTMLSSRAIGASVRAFGIILSILATIIIAPKVMSRFSSLDSELNPSTDYRENLWHLIPHDLVWIGQAHHVGVDSHGRSLYREFGSIDSTPLLIALDFGWIIVLSLTIGMCVIALRTIRDGILGRTSPASIALVGQIPTLLTVALITQYGAAVWLMVGIAAAQHAWPLAGQRSLRPTEPEPWETDRRALDATHRREPVPVDIQTPHIPVY
ncbi:hypothetical protein ACPXB3_17445 [Gordonia sp. DT219]|uniref:hypothetical protein n=1 Tax=Gordonia sp. DT219 TaxID=3416658 RepID=UPI003CF9F08D